MSSTTYITSPPTSRDVILTSRDVIDYIDNIASDIARCDFGIARCYRRCISHRQRRRAMWKHIAGDVRSTWRRQLAHRQRHRAMWEYIAGDVAKSPGDIVLAEGPGDIAGDIARCRQGHWRHRWRCRAMSPRPLATWRCRQEPWRHARPGGFTHIVSDAARCVLHIARHRAMSLACDVSCATSRDVAGDV